jgi:hypothetical protein
MLRKSWDQRFLPFLIVIILIFIGFLLFGRDYLILLRLDKSQADF